MSFVSAYSDRSRVRVSTPGGSRVQQHFKRDCDVNHIMAKYRNTMRQDYLSNYKGYVQGQFGDASASCSYQEAFQRVSDAQLAFDSLPSSVRSRFSNSPEEFLSFIGDSKNREEAINLGLIDKPVVPPVEPPK